MRRLSEPLEGAFPSWWSSLHDATPGASIYLSLEWMRTWVEVYGAEFGGSWIRWEEGGEVVGGMLLLTRTMRKWLVPLRSIFFNATGEASERTPLAEFNAVLCRPGHEAAVARDLAQLLASERWDRLIASGYEEGGMMDALVRAIPAAFVRADPRPAPYTLLAEVAAGGLDACISSNTRQQVRRARKSYEKERGPIAFEVAGSTEQAIDWLGSLARLHAERWVARGHPGSFASRATVFHEMLIRRLWPRGCIDLIRVRAGDAEVGYLYNFRARGKVYAFQSGLAFVEDARLKPGLLAHALAIEHYARAGLEEYDFLAGEARYKRSFGKSQRTLHWNIVYRDKPAMRLGVALWKLRSRMRESGPP
jgi:CelD/BcsL family acetyltransferase involved in cellulose biosynthesis